MPWVRIVSGAVALVVALGWVTLGGWVFTAGVSLMVFLGQREYFELARIKGILPATKTTLVVSQILVIVATVAPQFAEPVLAVGGSWICFYLLFQPKLATIADIATSILGLFYGGYLPSFWVRLRGIGYPTTHLRVNCVPGRRNLLPLPCGRELVISLLRCVTRTAGIWICACLTKTAISSAKMSVLMRSLWFP